jgi:hypothetical protein
MLANLMNCKPINTNQSKIRRQFVPKTVQTPTHVLTKILSSSGRYQLVHRSTQNSIC